MFIKDTYTKYPIIKFTIDRPLYFVLCKHNLTVIILGLKKLSKVKSLVLLFRHKLVWISNRVLSK